MISYLKSASGFLLRKSTYVDPWSMIIRLIAPARGSSLSTVRLTVRRDGNFAKRNIPILREHCPPIDAFFLRGQSVSGVEFTVVTPTGNITLGVHCSPMNAGRRPRQGQHRGNCSSSTRKRRHCDGTSTKENFRRASTCRTSSDLSGDHG